MTTVRRRGGARLGWTQATFPFASLEATPERLTVRMMLSEVRFRPEDVVFLQPWTIFPVLGRGLKIVHCHPDAPETVVFWLFGSPEKLAREIQDKAGFIPCGDAEGVELKDGIAFRTFPLVATVLLWNILFAAQFVLGGGFKPNELGLYPTLAAGLVALSAAGVLIPTPLRAVFLKPGRGVGEVRAFLVVLMLITGLLMAVGVSGLLQSHLSAS